MKTIWKYHLEDGCDDVEQSLVLPRGAQPMSCEVQNGTICVWVMCDDQEKRQERWTFYVVGTGNPLPNNPRIGLLNTVLQPPYVWHVFYEAKQ